MKRALAILLVFGAQLAHASPNQVLVLRSEGTADAATRTNIDTHVLRLAKNIEGNVVAGDITLTEAAAAVGCNAGDATCKDEVLTTFGVDEMIATTVTASPTGHNVTVRRLMRGTAPRAAQTTIAADAAADVKLDADIGPLFGLARPPEPVTEPAQPVTPTPVTPPPAEPPPPVAPPPPQVATATPPVAPAVTAAPNGAIAPPPEGAPKSRRLQKIGMGAGAGFMLLGFLMWSQAAAAQDDIDNAPVNTQDDFRRLEDLEAEADALAGGGNLFFLVGAGVAGISAYYYWKAGTSSSAQTARIAPTAFPHGAGLTLTIGGAP